MSAPSHLLYLLACANRDEPDAEWTIDGDGLVSAAGDRIAVTVRFHGYTAAIRRAGFRQVGVGHAEQLDALWGRMRDATRVRVSRQPEWLCHDPDEPDDTLWVAAATEEDARALADAERSGVDWHVTRITPQMRRRWRYHERREEGTLPPRKGRAKPCSPEAEAWYRGLGMMATMTMHDEQGRLRCETCRRFVTLDDLAGARTSYVGGGIAIDFGASCRRCRGVK